jgi:hypothetical protein
LAVAYYVNAKRNHQIATKVLPATAFNPVNGHTWPFKLMQEGRPQDWGVSFELSGTYALAGDHVAVHINSGSVKIGNNTSEQVKLRSLHLGLCSAPTGGQWDIYPHDPIPNTGVDFTNAIVTKDQQYSFSPVDLQLPLPPNVDPSDLWLCGFLWSNVGGSFPAHDQYRNTLKR